MRRYLTVPKGKCPLDVLAEQGEKIHNTWIFLSDSVVSELEKSEGVTKYSLKGGWYIERKETEEHPETMAIYQEFDKTGWFILKNVCSRNIAFSDISAVKVPEAFIFVVLKE